jgi:hypothetical protein
MKYFPFLSKTSFRPGAIFVILLIGVLAFSSVSAHAQRRGGTRTMKMGKWDKRMWKKNVIMLEGMGASGVVGLHYERIIMFGRITSMRFDVGLTPFIIDHNYDFTVGRNITPITGASFFLFPNAFKLGIGCSVLHDIYFDRIPETVSDTTHGGSELYAAQNYRVRIMPYIVVEGCISNRFIVRAGYSPIIDPANDAQAETYFTHWATIGFGYKFGK